MLEIHNFIEGRHTAPLGNKYLDKVDPATGVTVARVPDSEERDVDLAVAAARRAFPGWARTSAQERARLLLALADKIDQNLERLAQAECVDTGKPLRLARTVDIPRAATNFRFFATAIPHFHGESYRTDTLALNYVLRQPRGVAGLISPWNLPLYLFTWKVAPALATGNTVVAKPSELTPTTAHLLTELANEAGIPPGVFNVIHGRGATAGAALVNHPGVPTISFTGGTASGSQVAAGASARFKKLALELGGKNPNLLFADVNLAEVIPTTLRSSFENQGEICLCGSRILVEEALYPQFVEQFVQATRQLRVGDPLEPSTDVGAMISRAHQDKVLSYIRLAREEGGQVLCGGNPPVSLPQRCVQGAFVEPTVITGLPGECRVNQEEIFGPVVTILPFRDETEAIRLANGTPYGLSASLWTRDLSRAHRVAEQLECGTVWINCWLVRDLRVPFGGMKNSGVGREGGEEALRFFTDPKTICLKYPTEV